MANSTAIVQGAVTDVVVQPTWGLLDSGDRTAGLTLEQVRTDIQSLLDQNYYTKDDVDTALSEKVNKDGSGGMTGNLTIAKTNGSSFYAKATGATQGTPPASNILSGQFAFLDSVGNRTWGYMAHSWLPTGGSRLTLAATNKNSVNGNIEANNIELTMNADGSREVSIADSTAWRKALGLGTNGAFPIMPAQGGTGQTSIDTTPTSGSAKMVTSGGVYTALSEKVDKSGDTMTGDLSVKSLTADNSVTPSETIYRGINFKDKNGNNSGKVRSFWSKYGNVGCSLVAYRSVNGTDVVNEFAVGVTPTGGFVTSITPAAVPQWRKQFRTILYYNNRTLSAVTNSIFLRIPAGTATTTDITEDTVVLECDFTIPSAITSNITWQSYDDGYITFTGTCTDANCKANVVLGNKANN